VLARLLTPLFYSPIVVLVVLGLVGADVWLARTVDVTRAVGAVVLEPPLLLVVIGILLASTLFHELGHAAACRAGGAKPGTIGVAVYVVYPAFFTDVTDSYRLGRAGRVRTDLGGVYFNAISILVLCAVYARTASPVVLLAIVLVHIEMLQQLLPLGRLDGYFVLADLAGIPDLFGRIGPIFSTLLPWRDVHPKVAELRRSARVVVTLWVVVCVPLMAALIGLLLWSAPSLTAQVVDSMGREWQALNAAVPARDWATTALATLSLVLLPLPLVGMVWLVGGLLRRLLGALVRGLRRGSRAVVDSPSPRQGPGTRAPLTAADLLPSARPATRPRPTRGAWRRSLFAVTGGHLNLGPGPSERHELELRQQIRTRFDGTRRVVVLSRKGGAGKTTTTLMLGHTFAQERPDRVVALDANPDAGNLGSRLRRDTTNSATDLLANGAWIERYWEMQAYTTQDPDSRLEVLASDDDPRISQGLGRQDYRQLVDTLDRYYNLILVDTGTGILDDATQGVLQDADQLVLVVPPNLDGGRVAAMSLDWLEQHGYESLVWNAVTLMNGVSMRSRRLETLENHFRSRCGSVHHIPWDEALEAESAPTLDDLRPATRLAYLEVAAAVAGGFDSGARDLCRAAS
jgi:putative peptide zinc metalloprotease protein